MAPPTCVVDHTRTAKCPELLCPSQALLMTGWRPAPPRRALPLLHSSYELMRQTCSLPRIGVSTLSPAVFAGYCEHLLGTGSSRRYFRNSFPRCLVLNPDGPTECTCLFLPRCHRPSLDPSQVGLPLLSANTIFRGEVSRLSSDNSFVQASEFARLPDRSHRCKFCRAAETSTSGQNVLRYLCTHRICYPSDTGN
jgi:hypothetical protein